MSKPVVSADRVAALLRLLDGAEVPQALDEGALKKAKSFGYLVPSRFAPSSDPVRRPRIIAYRITAEGRDFLARVSAARPSSSESCG